MRRRSPYLLALAAIAALLCVQFGALAAPIQKSQLTTLLKFLKPDEVVQKIEADGVAFDADDATLDELRQLGASEEVLSAVKAAAASTPAPAASNQSPITYDEVKALVGAGLPESRVLEILRGSLVTFVLDATQERELGRLGASSAVISALKSTPDVGEVPDLVIILDCSGSMKETTSDGQQKMEAAKEVVVDLIEKIPDGLGLSLIVYGHDADLRCRAVEVLQPLQDMNDSNRRRLISSVERLRPVGATPIALALDTARQELVRHQSPNCGVILVSDGKETCHGNPADEAEELVTSVNTSFGLHVVGFDVSDDERAALEEIRSAAGEHGHYHEARNAEELATLIPEITAPAIPEPVAVPVRRVRGLKVLAPSTIPLPALSRISVVEAGGIWRPEGSGFKPVLESPTYGRDLHISSADESYDVFWVPKEGESVRMMAGVTFEKKEMVEVAPEEYLALVKVTGNSLPKPRSIAFTDPDGFEIDFSGFKRRGQTGRAYGESFVVPAGEWDLWIKPDDGSKGFRLEQRVEIKPGVLNVID